MRGRLLLFLLFSIFSPSFSIRCVVEGVFSPINCASDLCVVKQDSDGLLNNFCAEPDDCPRGTGCRDGICCCKGDYCNAELEIPSFNCYSGYNDFRTEICYYRCTRSTGVNKRALFGCALKAEECPEDNGCTTVWDDGELVEKCCCEGDLCNRGFPDNTNVSLITTDEPFDTSSGQNSAILSSDSTTSAISTLTTSSGETEVLTTNEDPTPAHIFDTTLDKGDNSEENRVTPEARTTQDNSDSTGVDRNQVTSTSQTIISTTDHSEPVFYGNFTTEILGTSPTTWSTQSFTTGIDEENLTDSTVSNGFYFNRTENPNYTEITVNGTTSSLRSTSEPNVSNIFDANLTATTSSSRAKNIVNATSPATSGSSHNSSESPEATDNFKTEPMVTTPEFYTSNGTEDIDGNAISRYDTTREPSDSESTENDRTNSVETSTKPFSESAKNYNRTVTTSIGESPDNDKSLPTTTESDTNVTETLGTNENRVTEAFKSTSVLVNGREEEHFTTVDEGDVTTEPSEIGFHANISMRTVKTTNEPNVSNSYEENVTTTTNTDGTTHNVVISSTLAPGGSDRNTEDYVATENGTTESMTVSIGSSGLNGTLGDDVTTVSQYVTDGSSSAGTSENGTAVTEKTTLRINTSEIYSEDQSSTMTTVTPVFEVVNSTQFGSGEELNNTVIPPHGGQTEDRFSTVLATSESLRLNGTVGTDGTPNISSEVTTEPEEGGFIGSGATWTSIMTVDPNVSSTYDVSRNTEETDGSDFDGENSTEIVFGSTENDTEGPEISGSPPTEPTTTPGIWIPFTLENNTTNEPIGSISSVAESTETYSTNPNVSNIYEVNQTTVEGVDGSDYNGTISTPITTESSSNGSEGTSEVGDPEVITTEPISTNQGTNDTDENSANISNVTKGPSESGIYGNDSSTRVETTTESSRTGSREVNETTRIPGTYGSGNTSGFTTGKSENETEELNVTGSSVDLIIESSVSTTLSTTTTEPQNVPGEGHNGIYSELEPGTSRNATDSPIDAENDSTVAEATVTPSENTRGSDELGIRETTLISSTGIHQNGHNGVETGENVTETVFGTATRPHFMNATAEADQSGHTGASVTMISEMTTYTPKTPGSSPFTQIPPEDGETGIKGINDTETTSSEAGSNGVVESSQVQGSTEEVTTAGTTDKEDGIKGSSGIDDATTFTTVTTPSESKEGSQRTRASKWVIIGDVTINPKFRHYGRVMEAPEKQKNGVRMRDEAESSTSARTPTAVLFFVIFIRIGAL